MQKSIRFVLVITFIFSLIIPIPKTQANILSGLPEPGRMVSLSAAYQPTLIKGVTVHKENPFLFDFIVDPGQDKLQAEAFKEESEKLVKYFLASLAIGEDDLWVNLSPYEKNRIIPGALGQTEMGRDLLAQDYMLKQITASLIYPEEGLGKKFWDRVYKKAQEQYGNASTTLSTSVFNKVWIMADRAKVFERNNSAFVLESHLKVMLEEDYVALNKNSVGAGPCAGPTCLGRPQGAAPTENKIGSQIIREIVIPALEHEVNEGKNFANLRQIFNSIILSSWYKKSLKNALLNQVYANKQIIAGIERPGVIARNTVTKQSQQDVSPEQIHERYLQAYKKGVFNFIKEENINGKTIPKKYFSGGVVIRGTAVSPAQLVVTLDEDQAMASPAMTGFGDGAMRVSVLADPSTIDKAAIGEPSSAAMMTPMLSRRVLFPLTLAGLAQPALGEESVESLLISRIKQGDIAEATRGLSEQREELRDSLMKSLIREFVLGRKFMIAEDQLRLDNFLETTNSLTIGNIRTLEAVVLQKNMQWVSGQIINPTIEQKKRAWRILQSQNRKGLEIYKGFDELRRDALAAAESDVPDLVKNYIRGSAVVSKIDNQNKAMTAVVGAKPRDGGIDLKTSKMKWDMQGQGGLDISAGGGSLPNRQTGAFGGKVDQAQVAQYLREGIKSLSVRVLRVEPITNVWAIFGMQQPARREDRMAMRNISKI